MTTEELKDKHCKEASYYWGDWTVHTNLSIQFAIDCLEEIIKDTDWSTPVIESKIEQLKKELQ